MSKSNPPTVFTFQHSTPRLSDPLRKKPTVLVPGGIDALGDAAYLASLEPSDPETTTRNMDLVRVVGIGFLTSAVSYPFNLAGTLTRVQYLPNDATQLEHVAEKQEMKEEEEDESTDSDEDEYYDPARRTAREKAKPAVVKDVDAFGYIKGVRGAPFQFPAESRSSWSTFMLLATSQDEGFLSLWKGHGTYWLRELLHTSSQPAVEGFVNDRLGLYDDTIPLQHLDKPLPNLVTMIASHIVVGVLLSPLELIRTRLAIQTHNEKKRRYAHPLDALSHVFNQEHYASLKSLYFSTHLFVPTLLTYTITPFVDHAAPLFIEHYFGISSVDSPALYGFYEFVWRCVGAALTMPIETVRTRLQAQVVGGARELETCVQIAPRYTGVVDCVRRMIKEEGGKRSKKAKQVGWWDSWGVQPLYRGYTFTCLQYGAIYAAGLINGAPIREDW
jgi:fusion and transport protein UGO1